MKKPRIFSGADSKNLWKNIAATQESTLLVWSALMSLAERCKQLEQRVEEIEKDSRVRLGRGK